jgi:uncharacterized membrane protein YjjP (DUF1212 family)
MTIAKPCDKRNAAAEVAARRLQLLVRFGALMLSAGETVFRVRRSMRTVARAMGFESWSVHLSSRNLIATGQRDAETVTLVCDVPVPGVNTERIGALEELANSLAPQITRREFAQKLAAIENTPPRYSILATAAAVGVACGAFDFLNGGSWPEVVTCVIAAGVGQGLRSILQRRRFNQYVVTALSALVASGVYCLASAAAIRAGFGIGGNSIGLISSILFLVPGFPLVTALLDQLQHETSAALMRLAHAGMLLLTAAVGLSVMIALVGFSVADSAQLVLAKPLMLILWAAASFCGGCGFAILYNGTWRNVLCVGVIAIIGNETRLSLHASGVRLPLATFIGALGVGLAASLVGRWIKQARVALTVPGVIIMVPGLYIFETLVYLNRGEILNGLAAGVLVGFVVGAIAFGLAAARFISQPEWLKESE